MKSKSRRGLRNVCVVIATLMVSQVVWARVFDINEQVFSSYFKGGTAVLTDQPSLYEHTSAEEAKWQSTPPPFSYNGELGFILLAERFSLRVGAEYLKTVQGEAKAVSGDQDLYSVTTNGQALVPKVALDLHLKRGWQSRWLLSFEVGMAQVTLNNDYKITPDGESELGVSDFKQTLASQAMTYEVRLGYESLFTDATTYLIEVGYRHLQLDSLEAVNAYQGFEGAVPEGSVLKADNGQNQSADLSGISINFGFKFYL